MSDATHTDVAHLASADSAAAERRDRRKKRAAEDADFTSGQISERARYIGFGLAAFTVLIMTSPSAKPIFDKAGATILVCSALGCLAIAFDYLQYLFGHVASRNAMRNSAGDFGYDTKSATYRARTWFFVAKQVAAMFGSIVFIVTLLSLAVTH